MRPTHLFGLLLLALAPRTAATTHFVNAAAASGGDGSSWSLAFADLQDALAVAQSGDEIWVAAGVYKPTDGLDRTISFELVSGVAVYGGFNGTESSLEQRDWVANETILSGDLGVAGSSFYDEYQELRALGLPHEKAMDALRPSWRGSDARQPQESSRLVSDNSYHVVRCTNTVDGTLLDGFTVIGGSSLDNLQQGKGAGLLLTNATLELRHCVVKLNSAGNDGGGLAADATSRVHIADCQFRGNYASHQNGAVYSLAAELLVERTVIESNHAWYGNGGIAGVGTFVDVDFVANTTDEVSSALGWGGTGSSYLERVTFRNNRSTGSGGGAGQSTMYGRATLVDVVFENNRVGAGYSPGAGGFYGAGALIGVQFLRNTSTGAGAVRPSGPTTIANCLFALNAGQLGALYVGDEISRPDAPLFSGTVEIINSTFAENLGNAVLSRWQDVSVTNSIVLGPSAWDHEYAQYVPSINRSQVSFSHSLVEGGGGSGPTWNPDSGIDAGFNIDLPPYFVDAANGDYRLQPGSPGVDMGSNALLPIDLLTDLAGNPRVYGVAVDMGAYELQTANCADFEVSFGESWDGAPLQQVLDENYGQGNIDALDDYEGAHCGDAAIPYWLDSSISGWIARVISGSGSSSEFGWYREEFQLPSINGVDDGVIFAQGSGDGQSTVVELPGGPARFGFYLRSAGGAETFFTHRQLNDDGDPQCLVYDISRLRGGQPTYVLAWEDHDAGNPIDPTPHDDATDNDYQDLVVEIQAVSPVPVLDLRLSAVREAHGVRLQWELPRIELVERLELMRRRDGRETTLLDLSGAELRTRREYMDASFDEGMLRSYWLRATTRSETVSSEELQVETPVLAQRTGMLRAQPNPFNPSTQLVFVNQHAGEVTLRIFDAAGRLVRTMALGELAAGVQSVQWDGQDDRGAGLASGVYAVSVGTGSVLKVVLVK